MCVLGGFDNGTDVDRIAKSGVQGFDAITSKETWGRRDLVGVVQTLQTLLTFRPFRAKRRF